MGIGFWNPEIAGVVHNSGMTPIDARQAADSLISRDAKTDPIDAICNNDMESTVLTAEHERLLGL